ncbi:Rv3654c family TadE-like protein [Janibacter sp. GS2]|uniref:Rv3654c family TadE-like protein n=1 Tax=Janibacter sp. GS2 TaxID=3442646 RepID=UPI003EBFC71B
MPRREIRDEKGSSTVMALGLIAVLLTVTVAALAVLGAMRAVHVARSTADLAALAGAVVYQQVQDDPAACAEARRIARRHDAQVVACEVGAGGEVTVTTSVPITPRVPGVVPDRAEGRARAGPAPQSVG